MNEPFAQTNQESTEAIATKQLVGFFIGMRCSGWIFSPFRRLFGMPLITADSGCA
jgi:hypothetical protein